MRGGIFDYLDWTVQPWPDRIKLLSRQTGPKNTNVNIILCLLFILVVLIFYMRYCMKCAILQMICSTQQFIVIRSDRCLASLASEWI